MKILIAILVALVAMVICIMPITKLMVQQGIKNKDKEWAPGVVYQAGRIRMRLQQYRSSGQILEKALEVFPKYKDAENAHFWIAICYEKTKRPDEAMKWYKKFVEKYPNHMWVDQAKRRMAMIEGQATPPG
ncbi:MAG: hypothetical protein A3K19_01390 [Lentisphaerae bacterium RIFOXYB12_FULL_65_16]|nr:MAG: hypothetical protein A3K18_22745 [Lentisphaerae bacterium RIFOXYA12_64_32]OGV92797.1 MAG: hypothetical protein A3K19_01390 [Lentisphaerae bacterium RIFOXYB12_FULL_65_16]